MTETGPPRSDDVGIMTRLPETGLNAMRAS